MGDAATGALNPEPGQGEQFVQSGGGQGGEQSTGGQDLIKPYLEDVTDPEVRELLSSKLDAFRSEQDSRVNRKLEEQAQKIQKYEQHGTPEDVEVATLLYDSLLQDPTGTVDWIADQFQQHFGRDLRTELSQRYASQNGQAPMPQQPQVTPQGVPQQQTQPNPYGQQPYQAPTPQGQQQPGQQPVPDDPSQRPLTQKDLEEWSQRQEQERQRAEQEEQRRQQAMATTNQWLDESAEKFSLQFTGPDDPLRSAIMLQASQLHQAGQAQGQAAVEMATKAVADRLRSMGNPQAAQGQQPQPRTTPDGGGRPPAEPVDVSDPSARQEAMYAAFTANRQQE